MTSFKTDMKAIKQQMKDAQMMEAVRHATEKARIAQEYADRLEALILSKYEPVAEEVKPEITVEPIEEFISEELVVAEEIKEIIPSESLGEIAPSEVEGIVSIALPASEPKTEEKPNNEEKPKNEIKELEHEILRFLFCEFVNKQQGINHIVDDFYNMFKAFSKSEVGKNTFTKQMRRFGIWSFKSNSHNKFKVAISDLERAIKPFTDMNYVSETEKAIGPVIPEPDVEVVVVPEVVPEQVEQDASNNFFLAMEEQAEMVELKSASKKNQKIQKALDELF
jgi:hypothetical protein